MGKELFCDLCRRTIAIESQLIPVIIGTIKVGEVCLNCSSTLEAGIKKQIFTTTQQFKAAAALAEAQELLQGDQHA